MGSQNNPGFTGHGKKKDTLGISLELFNPNGKRFAYLGMANGTGGD